MPDLTKPAASSAEIDLAGAAATLVVMVFVRVSEGVEYLVSVVTIASENRG
jgi:hypothetical protein